MAERRCSAPLVPAAAFPVGLVSRMLGPANRNGLLGER